MTGGDRRQGSGAPPRRQGSQQYVWSASLPSPAVVSELEALFPDIVQLPLAAIDIETKAWTECGLIVRSLSRWVPPEAIVRELHRSGIAGRIDTISLSHRTALIKFELPAARDLVLNQPWVVNGQPLAVAAWYPDFVPADDALSSALLWIRLPNLPIEYWSDETLSSILSVAGHFVDADASTKQRRRGGFARACVKVDLSRPLRPGARIRAYGAPFWQQFVYEHVDGICSLCGSLHLSGPCASSLEPASSSAAPRFGPWMAALRHRIPSSGAGSGPRSSSSVPLGDARKGASPEDDGWSAPRKFARRRSQPSSSSGTAEVPVSGPSDDNEPCRHAGAVPVTVDAVLKPPSQIQKPSSRKKLNSLLPKKNGSDHSLNSGFKFSALMKGSSLKDPEANVQINVETKAPLKESSATESVAQMESSSSHSATMRVSSRKVATNPFGLLGSDRWAGVPKDREDANPVLLKRARSAEGVAPSVRPRPAKGKGKGGAGAQGVKSRGAICSDVFLGDSQLPPLDSCAHLTAVTTLKEALMQASDPDHRGDQGIVDVLPSPGGLSEMDITGSRDGDQSIPDMIK